MNKAFINHRINGVLITFPNGNTISTIWGIGSYTEHHNDDNYMDFDKRIEDGSNNVEIMVTTDNKRLYNRIHKRLNGDGSVIGWVSVTDWLWVLNVLHNDKIGHKVLS